MNGSRSPTLADIEAFSIDAIAEICRRYPVRSLRIFGSVARGTAQRSSDVDVLVEFAEPVSLLDLVRLEREWMTAKRDVPGLKQVVGQYPAPLGAAG